MARQRRYATKSRRSARPADPEILRGEIEQSEPSKSTALVTPAQAISGIASAVWDWRQIEDFTVQAVNRALADRQIPRSDLIEPRLDVVVPAVEAMRYAALRNEIANLVATSMDRRAAADAHPAFVEILKQLSEDEARMLRLLPDREFVLPVADIRFVTREKRSITAYKNVIPQNVAAACAGKRQIPTYIDNLMRLNLIESPQKLTISETRLYRELLAQPFVIEITRDTRRDQKVEIDRRLMRLTDFGQSFRRACFA